VCVNAAFVHPSTRNIAEEQMIIRNTVYNAMIALSIRALDCLYVSATIRLCLSLFALHNV